MRNGCSCTRAPTRSTAARTRSSATSSPSAGSACPGDRRMYETDSPEQAALREAVRDFCRQHQDASAWRRLSGELGLAGLAVGEHHGGMGGGLAEVAVAAEELGRVLLPVPYLSTALAGVVLGECEDAPAAALLPGLASGELA